MRRWQPRTLAGTFLVLQLAVVALVLLVAAVVSVRQAQAQFRSYAAERILGAAESLASNPLVRERGLAPSTAGDLAPVAESVRIQSGASTVLLAGLDRRIVAASDPTLVGTVLALPDEGVWSGRSWGGDATLAGQQLIAAAAPVYAATGAGPELLGLALVGEAYPAPWSPLLVDVPEAALLLGLAALAGVIGSWLLARRIKAQTHGLEPAEIATLAEQREALLYSIREGVLGVDSADRVTFANDGARDLLDLPEQCVGRRTDELALSPAVVDVLLGRVAGTDVVVLHRDRALVVNRRTARTSGQRGAAQRPADRHRDHLAGPLRPDRGATPARRHPQRDRDVARADPRVRQPAAHHLRAGADGGVRRGARVPGHADQQARRVRREHHRASARPGAGRTAGGQVQPGHRVVGDFGAGGHLALPEAGSRAGHGRGHRTGQPGRQRAGRGGQRGARGRRRGGHRRSTASCAWW